MLRQKSFIRSGPDVLLLSLIWLHRTEYLVVLTIESNVSSMATANHDLYLMSTDFGVTAAR